MKIDWKLKGFNLLKFNCNKEQIVHPETCSDMVQMEHDGEINLTDWIKSGTGSIGENLASWINTNFSESIDVNADWTPNTALGTLTDANSLSLGWIEDANLNPIRVPYATTVGGIATYGILKAGIGLLTTNGQLDLQIATNSSLGGVRVANTETLGDNYRVLRQGNIGPAYVDLSNINANTYLYNWYGSDTAISIENPKPIRAFYIKDNANDPYEWEGDALFNLLNDLVEYDERFKNLYSQTNPNDVKERIYPIRADKVGRLYTYVDWTDTNTTYSDYAGSIHGLVPSGTGETNPSTKFLNANGSWAVPYTTFSTSNNGLVPASGANTTKFLKGDGTWAIPTDTTYDVATTSNKQGLLQIIEGCSNVSCTIVELSESPENIVPVVYNNAESKEGHGVVLEDIVDAISKNKELLRIIAQAMADDTESTVGCVDILKAVINP